MLTVVIPAVEARAHMLDRLIDDVKACSLTLREPVVVPHIDGTAPSADPPRVFRECERAPTEWALHLEDDARLGPDAHKIPEILDRAPFDMVSFFSLRDMPDGLHQIRPKGFCSTVCVALRTAAVDGLGNFAESWYPAHPRHHHAADLILGDFAATRRIDVGIYAPSLVQHLALPSTLGPRSTKRQSPTYRRRYGDA